MVKINLQLFGGRGMGSKISFTGGITKVRKQKDMLSERAKFPEEVDQVMNVSQRLNNLYGDDGVITQFMTASMEGALGAYDTRGNISIDRARMNTAGMDAAFDEGVKVGFHPSRGNKSGLEAVSAHEFGHALTDRAATKLGFNNGLGFEGLDKAASEIVARAMKKTGSKRQNAFAKRISGYATKDSAELVAEAFGDWYCNGNKARKESRAVVAVLNSILKGGKK